jgi:TM2 domain-containing membrane protein YozV
VAVKCKHCGSLIGPAGGAALSGVEVAEPGEGEPFSFLNSLGSSAAGDSGSRATPRARRAGPSAAQSNRIVVGACAILLGSLGIHKFILGLTAPGVIMLVVTALTANWAHVWGALPMGIIGLIEGIIYLTKSDEEFHQRYVVEKQAWF